MKEEGREAEEGGEESGRRYRCRTEKKRGLRGKKWTKMLLNEVGRRRRRRDVRGKTEGD